MLFITTKDPYLWIGNWQWVVINDEKKFTVPEDGFMIVLPAVDKIWTPVSEGVSKTILTYT